MQKFKQYRRKHLNYSKQHVIEFLKHLKGFSKLYVSFKVKELKNTFKSCFAFLNDLTERRLQDNFLYCLKSNYLKDILFETETAISHLIISCQFLQLFLASLFFRFVSLVGKKRNWSLKELHHPFLVDWFNKSWFDLKTSFFFRIIFKTKTHTDVVQTSLRELLMFT